MYRLTEVHNFSISFDENRKVQNAIMKELMTVYNLSPRKFNMEQNLTLWGKRNVFQYLVSRFISNNCLSQYPVLFTHLFSIGKLNHNRLLPVQFIIWFLHE